MMPTCRRAGQIHEAFLWSKDILHGVLLPCPFAQDAIHMCAFAPLQELRLLYCELQQLPPWLPKLRSLQQLFVWRSDMAERETQWSSCAPALRSFTAVCSRMEKVSTSDTII